MKALHDYFPCTIVAVPPNVVELASAVTTSPSSLPQGAKILDNVRLVIMQDEKSLILMIAGDHHAGPRLIFSERLADLTWSGNKMNDSQALTQSGKIIAFRKTQGCSSCGSRLRSWSPYRTMDSIKDPTE